MIISLHFNDEESMLIEKYAEIKELSVPELVRQILLERIEDECDLETCHNAMAVYREDPSAYSLAEVEKELGL